MTTKSIALWPGLPELWYRGDIRSLSLSLIFAVTLNMALMGTFVWTAWYPAWVIRLFWCGIVFASLFSFARARKNWDSITGRLATDSKANDRLIEAQRQYLQGNFFEAEAMLHRNLSQSTLDVESALLLISVLRRTRRWQQALHWIEQVMLRENSARWHRDLMLEKQKIERSMNESESSQQASEVAVAAARSTDRADTERNVTERTTSELQRNEKVNDEEVQSIVDQVAGA
jgi:hypothetical protein